MNKLKSSLCLLAALMTSQSSAVVVSFTGGLDADVDSSNLSATTPYNAASASTQNNSGVLSGATSHNETYFFADATTGLAYSFDATWTATGGTFAGTDSILGVGAGNLINPGESITIAISNLVVDVSGYVDGTIGGLTGPLAVTGQGLGFNAIAGQFRGGATAVNFTEAGGTPTTLMGPTLNANSGLPAVALGDTGTAYTVSDPVEGNIRLNALRITALIDVEAIPEPSAVALLGLGFLSLIGRRRR